MRSGECEDDVVVFICHSEDETICLYRCNCRTRRVRENKNEEWEWYRILCFEHELMNKKSPELLKAYLAGLKKSHMTTLATTQFPNMC